jgi:DNA-binding ferritin-like protein
MSDTPETDREEIVMGRTECDRYVLAEFARRLERERASAIKKIQRQAERIRQLEGATNYAGGTPLSIALRERDEAITARKASVAQLMEQISKAEKRVKEAQEIAACALIERDEILKSLKK